MERKVAFNRDISLRADEIKLWLTQFPLVQEILKNKLSVLHSTDSKNEQRKHILNSS